MEVMLRAIVKANDEATLGYIRYDRTTTEGSPCWSYVRVPVKSDGVRRADDPTILWRHDNAIDIFCQSAIIDRKGILTSRGIREIRRRITDNRRCTSWNGRDRCVDLDIMSDALIGLDL